MTETTHVYTNRSAKPREERGMYHTREERGAYDTLSPAGMAERRCNTRYTVLMHGYMPVMYFTRAGFVLWQWGAKT